MPITINGTTGISGVDGSAATPALQGSDTNTGIAFGSDVILASTGGTERFRCDSSGRMLVGTSSAPTVTDAQYGLLRVQGNSAGSTFAGIFSLGRGKAATSITSGEEIGRLLFTDNAGNNFATIDCLAGANAGTNDYPGTLSFSTTADGASSPTERMRIKADGNINLSSAVYNNTTVNAANMFINTSPDYGIFRSTSSIKYKTSVETIEDSYSDAILNCRPVWYRSLCSGDNKDYGYWGFIAEEVAAVDPRLVFWTTEKSVTDEDGTESTVKLEEPIADGVQYDRFVPHLLNLIKRQQAKIESLETRLAALEVTP